jgi:AAA+ superfamily predicted ATPase
MPVAKEAHPVNAATPERWLRANRERLDALLASLGGAIGGTSPWQVEPAPPTTAAARIDTLAEVFGLGTADLTALLLATAQELRTELLKGQRATVAQVLKLAGESARSALCPQAPLRRWRMVELDGGGGFDERVLRLDERILHHLLGVDYLDARLDGMVELAPLQPSGAVPQSLASPEQLAALSRAWQPSAQQGWPVLELCGPSREAQRALAAALAAPTGQRLYRLMRADIPRHGFERIALARLADREMALSNGILVIEGDSGGEDDDRLAAGFVDQLLCPTVVAARDALPLDRRRRLRHDLPAATPAQRRGLWMQALGERASALGPLVERLSEQFTLDGATLRAAADLAQDALGARDPAFGERLWEAARAQARRRLDDLAERIASGATWDDLVLPEDRLAQLREIASHVRHAHRVHEDWGWSARGPRGLGVTALFAGPSGTGKTLAAEVLAADLQLDLYRIDLSQVVSKYIGETEKNLRRIFDAAEAGGAVLLFDEADALFGKRSEVKDSHDRYANIEVSYLLQRMEAYRGLALLTTNLKSALDTAFLRRLRFVVDFPFPDAIQRAGIWRRVFPARTPVQGLDPARLARLAVAGGAIRTMAINAAFLAARDQTEVRPEHLAAAARQEYAKLGKPATPAEFGGWP